MKAESSPRTTIIYGLCDPRDGMLRYIGKTVYTIEIRLRQHIHDARRNRVSIKRFSWVNQLTDLGLAPDIFELEVVAAEWQECEQFWISYFSSLGAELVNATAGGDGLHSFKHTDETKRKQSEAAKRRYADPAERQRSGDAVRAAFQDPIKKGNLRAALAAVWTPEARARLSEAVSQACKRPEVKAKRSAAQVGKAFSPATRAKLSACRLGVSKDPAAVEKSAAWHRGKKRSDETRARIAAGVSKASRDKKANATRV